VYIHTAKACVSTKNKFSRMTYSDFNILLRFGACGLNFTITTRTLQVASYAIDPPLEPPLHLSRSSARDCLTTVKESYMKVGTAHQQAVKIATTNCTMHSTLQTQPSIHHTALFAVALCKDIERRPVTVLYSLCPPPLGRRGGGQAQRGSVLSPEN